MRATLTAILLLLQMLCYGQLIEDKTIEKQYFNALSKASARVKELTNDDYKKEGTSSFIIQYKTDTLNKKNLETKLNSVIILDLETNKETKHPDETIEFPMPWAAQGYLSGDTLLIHTGLLLPGSITKVYRSKITTLWNEYRKYDKIFRLKLNQKKVNDIFVPTQISRLTLSNLHPKTGQTIYGKLELKTVPYYIDDTMFTKGYIHQQVDLVCYFHFKLIRKDW